MIHDTFHSITAQWLKSSSPVLKEAFGWIDQHSTLFKPGITELQGMMLYVNVHGYETLPADQCAWESHRHTVDIQYCIRGGEIIEWMPQTDLPRFGEYNAEKDTEKWQDRPDHRVALTMQAGRFAMFFPHELHRPKQMDHIHSSVEKLVVKIDAELLSL